MISTSIKCHFWVLRNWHATIFRTAWERVSFPVKLPVCLRANVRYNIVCKCAAAWLLPGQVTWTGCACSFASHVLKGLNTHAHWRKISSKWKTDAAAYASCLLWYIKTWRSLLNSQSMIMSGTRRSQNDTYKNGTHSSWTCPNVYFVDLFSHNAWLQAFFQQAKWWRPSFFVSISHFAGQASSASFLTNFGWK